MCFLHEPTRWLKSLKELSGRDKFCTSRQEGDQGTEPKMGHIRFSMSRAWSSLLLQSRQSPQILTLTRLLVMKDLFIYLFSFSPLHQKGPEQARANYNFLQRLFGNEHEKALPVSSVSPTPLSRWKQLTSSCPAGPGHWALQKRFPRWLHILSHSSPVIFQTTWGLESKWSSETASAAKFFLDSFGNDRKLPYPAIWVLQTLSFGFPHKVISWSRFLGRSSSAMHWVYINRPQALFYQATAR